MKQQKPTTDIPLIYFIPSYLVVARLFENVELCHSSTDRMEKKCVLFAFKKSIAELNSQFDDDSQKVCVLLFTTHSIVQPLANLHLPKLFARCVYLQDVCEFLSCVLTKTRSLSVDLHQSAVNMGMTCTCPVNAHMAFQMLSTRSCMGYELKHTYCYITNSLETPDVDYVHYCFSDLFNQDVSLMLLI